MTSVKKEFPNLGAVQQRFDAVIHGQFDDFLSSTYTRRQAMLGNRRYMMIAAAFTIAVVVAMLLFQGRYGDLVEQLLISVMILWLLVVLLSAERWFTNDKLLAKEVNMALAPIVGSTLNRTVVYAYDIAHRAETTQLLQDSELMTTAGIDLISDDVFTVFGDHELSLRELVVTKSQKGDKEDSDITQLFKGVFVVATVPKVHKAKTFISTEGDQVGFAHRTFWAGLFEHTAVKETKLEWNDFEAVLHVASTDPVASREILTADLMQDVYDWWQEHKLNMRIAFIGNKLYMLLPEESIKIGTSTRSTEVADISRYAFTVIRPMWRSLVLLEDVTS